MYGAQFGSFPGMPQLWCQRGMSPQMFKHWGHAANQNQASGAPPHGGCRGMRKAWRKWSREMYNKKHGKRHGCPRAEGENNTEQMEAEVGGVSNTAEKDATKKTGAENKKDADVEESSSDEGEGGEGYLEAMGKTFAAFLSPFGKL